jgi:hypothetical protein
VRSWFKKTRKNHSQLIIADLESRLQQITNQFKQIEEKLELLASQQPQITIENIHIHQPVLEKVEYRLDKLDIDTLSGSLNLGNNFGTKLNPIRPHKKAPSLKKQGSAEPDSTKDNEADIQQTSFGYRLRRHD